MYQQPESISRWVVLGRASHRLWCMTSLVRSLGKFRILTDSMNILKWILASTVLEIGFQFLVQESKMKNRVKFAYLYLFLANLTRRVWIWACRCGQIKAKHSLNGFLQNDQLPSPVASWQYVTAGISEKDRINLMTFLKVISVWGFWGVVRWYRNVLFCHAKIYRFRAKIWLPSHIFFFFKYHFQVISRVT